MAGEETKESLQAKAKASLWDAAGSDAVTMFDASTEHWREGKYLEAAGDRLNAAVTGIAHELRHPIKTLEAVADASIDTIKASTTPSVEQIAAAGKQKTR
jgi:hypothetical protein